jgi:Enoyl-(Acyl carrier protein) reductase
MHRLAGIIRPRVTGGGRIIATNPPAIRSGSTSTQLADEDLRPLRPRFDLGRKNIVLTGAGRGITYAAARAVAEFGGNVAVLDILPKPVDDFQKLSKEFSVKTAYIHADVTSESSLTKAFNQVVDEFGTIDGW